MRGEDPEEDATGTLLGMKQEACNVFGDAVTRLGLEDCRLIEMLDERPSVIRDLMAKVCPSIATQTILDHLDTLRTQLNHRL